MKIGRDEHSQLWRAAGSPAKTPAAGPHAACDATPPQPNPESPVTAARPSPGPLPSGTARCLLSAASSAFPPPLAADAASCPPSFRGGAQSSRQSPEATRDAGSTGIPAGLPREMPWVPSPGVRRVQEVQGVRGWIRRRATSATWTCIVNIIASLVKKPFGEAGDAQCHERPHGHPSVQAGARPPPNIGVPLEFTEEWAGSELLFEPSLGRGRFCCAGVQQPLGPLRVGCAVTRSMALSVQMPAYS